MHLVFLQGLALGKKQRDYAVCVIVGTKDLRTAGRYAQMI
jgi:hypothetical protein